MAYLEELPCQTEKGCPFSTFQIDEEVRFLNPDGRNDKYVPGFKARLAAIHVAECLKANQALDGRDPETTYLTGRPVSACPPAAAIQFQVLDFVESCPEVLGVEAS